MLFHRLRGRLAVTSTLATVICLGLSVGSAGAKPDQKLKGTIRIDGSSTVFPVTEAVAEEFQKEHRRVRVTVGISGTGGGFQKFAKGDITINNASRPIKDNEVKLAQQNKVEFIELPIAYDGISVVMSKRNDFVKSLTIDQLKKLWEPGSKVKTWADLNPAWPKKNIKLYGPGPDSGTFDYFTEEVVGKSRASRSDYTASEDDNVLVTGIAHDPYALGYFGVAYYVENQDKLKAVPIDAGKGPIAPTDDTIETAKYPLSRPLFIYVSLKDTSHPEVDAFVRFYLANAGKLANEVGYTSLSQKIYGAAEKRYNERKTGKWASTIN